MQWYQCPNCGQKLFMIAPDAVIKGLQEVIKDYKKYDYVLFKQIQ